MSKIIQIFLIFFYIEKYNSRGTFFVFENFNFYTTLFSEMTSNFDDFYSTDRKT